MVPLRARRETEDVELAAYAKVLAMLQAGPDACNPASELADEAGPAEQQPPQEQQQQSHGLADERGRLASAHLAGDVVFLGTAESRVPILQSQIKNTERPL